MFLGSGLHLNEHRAGNVPLSCRASGGGRTSQHMVLVGF